MRTQFTDRYDDVLEVSAAAGNIYVQQPDPHLHEGYDKINEWDFSRETAVELANTILKLVGEDDKSTQVVHAASISFNEGVLRLAAIHKKTVEFRYVKDNAKPPETRRFVPSSVTGSGNNLRFTGWDEDREAVRAFRLDRIKGTVGVIA